jgi:hypothetical protein
MAMRNHYGIDSKPVMFIICQSCKRDKAEIFQVDGDYCLSCWQEKTHTNV